MITVYCEKMAQTGLSSPAIGLIGIIIGAVIGLGTSYLNQRWQHRNAVEIEERKNKIKLFTEFALKDLLGYIDTEVNYIQRVYYQVTKGEIPSEDYDGKHREQLGKYKALLEMFKDDKLIANFNTLLDYRRKIFESKEISGKFIKDPAVLLNEAAALAGDIRLSLFEHCSLK